MIRLCTELLNLSHLLRNVANYEIPFYEILGITLKKQFTEHYTSVITHKAVNIHLAA